MTSFALEPIYGSLLLAIAAVSVTVVVIFVVTPPMLDRTRRRWLIGLRLAAATVLILAMLRPTLVRSDNRPVDAALIVAVDTSRSMTLPDGDGSDRWSTQVEAWRQLASGLAGRDAELELRLLGYDATTRAIGSVAPDALASVEPRGEQTDLQAAIAATIAAADHRPIAGVVMMGDGNQTAPIIGGGAGRVVETLDSLGVPFWTVPIGPPKGESMSRDVAIDALPESYQLFAGNQVDITFQVSSRGMSGTNVPVSVTWIDDQGKRVDAAVRSVPANQSIDVVPVTVSVTTPPPGTYQLQVTADAQDGELVIANNTQIAFVDVREGGGRILYLFGNLDQEQSLIRRALRRFPDLDVTFRWIPTDTAKAWPVDFRQWFEVGKFDIYLIGDLPADALGNQQLKQLAGAVDAGAGLVTLGGVHAYGNGGYADSPLADVIPVIMDAGRRRSVNDEVSAENQIDPPVEVRLARNHPITDLGGGDPAKTWRELPPLLGANRLVGPKVAPGVQVLLESDRQNPLLVIGQYGRGRTSAIAMDSTWRWWRSGDSDTHRRFWRQLMLWLLSREDSTEDDILVELDSRRFSSDQPPDFRATADAPDLSLVAEIVSGDGERTQSLAVIAEGAGVASGSANESVIRGSLPKLAPGVYRLRVSADGDTNATERSFQVIDESRELSQPMADPVFMRQLAELTADHGGAAFNPSEVDALVEIILKMRKRSETPVIERARLGDGPLTGWPLFLVFAGCLSTEWWLRRRWGLA